MAIDKFNFEQWETRIRRFKYFKIASGLKSKMDEEQISTLKYSLGNKQICYNISTYRRKIRENNNIIIIIKFSSASEGEQKHYLRMSSRRYSHSFLDSTIV